MEKGYTLITGAASDIGKEVCFNISGNRPLILHGRDKLKLENIALERKWILKGESPDTERTAIYVLKDFREGRLGLFILDEMLPEV